MFQGQLVGSVKSNNIVRIIKLHYVRLVRKKEANTTENSNSYQAITSLKARSSILEYMCVSILGNSIE